MPFASRRGCSRFTSSGPLGCLLLALLCLQPALAEARSIVPAGSATVWRYLDDGKGPPANWREVEFDDSQWRLGKSPLGYGRAELGSQVGFGDDPAKKHISTWLRLAFQRPELKPGERLVVVFCVDDGAVFNLNGREFGRANMPQGPIAANTTTPRAVNQADEGYYERLPLPVEALRPGRNVLAVEVHQCSPTSHDLFFDLALKTVPPNTPAPPVPASAREVVELYRTRHYVGPGVTIPDGYEDGGRTTRIDELGRPSSSVREILVVDRAHDADLARDLEFARSPELKALPPLERALRLAVHIDREATTPANPRWVAKTCEVLEKEFVNRPILLGEWLDQGHAGVCRHRSLLFKLLADEAGLRAALIRGNLTGTPRGAHAWNELILDGGRRVLVDVSLKGGRQDFPEVDSPAVAERYLRPDNKPWYGGKP